MIIEEETRGGAKYLQNNLILINFSNSICPGEFLIHHRHLTIWNKISQSFKISRSIEEISHIEKSTSKKDIISFGFKSGFWCSTFLHQFSFLKITRMIFRSTKLFKFSVSPKLLLWTLTVHFDIIIQKKSAFQFFIEKFDLWEFKIKECFF